LNSTIQKKRGVYLDELLPPVPPGEKKKESFFKKLFSKKEKPIILETESSSSALQMVVKEAPSNLEKIPVAQEMDSTPPIQPMGFEEIIERSIPRPPESLQNTLAELKPRYTPAKLPEMPHLTTNPEDYKTMDFTKDPPAQQGTLESTGHLDFQDYKRLQKEKTENIEPAGITKKGKAVEPPKLEPKSEFDWTHEFEHHGSAPKENEPLPTIEPAAGSMKSLQPEFLDEFDEKYKRIFQKKAKELTEGGLEKELSEKISEPKKIDFTQEPVPLKPAIQKTQIAAIPAQEKQQDEKIIPKVEAEIPVKKDPDRDYSAIITAMSAPPLVAKANLNNESSKQALSEPPPIAKTASESQPVEKAELPPIKQLTMEEQFLSQPALKFTMQLKEKLKEQVRVEERKKIFGELDAEKEEFKRERDEFEKIRGTMERIEVQKEALSNLKEEVRQERADMQREQEESRKLRAELAKLKNEHSDWQARIKEINEKLDINKRIEENLAERELALKEAQEKLAGMEQMIKERGFSEFLGEELNKKEIHYPEYNGHEDDLKKPYGELYELTDECRNLIWQNKLDDAKGIYMRAREMYHGIISSGDQNEELYMLIRELYDDLNLAILKE
jgi:hypothetical protein